MKYINYILNKRLNLQSKKKKLVESNQKKKESHNVIKTIYKMVGIKFWTRSLS